MANSKNITFDQLQAALSRVKSALDGKANTSHGNHVPKTETANNARFLRNDNTWQTITPVNIGAADRSHSHGSYVNQNAFSNIKVGDTTVAADSPTDTLTLTAGANVTITPDATNDSVTIAAKDTVYTHPTTSGYKHIPSGGSSGQILRWSADGTAAWGSDNNTDTKVTNTLNTTAKAYVTGTTSATTNTGTQVFDTSVYLDTTAGKLVATTFAGALSGNATTATTLANSRKFTIGNTERTFNGSGDVKWTLADIGAAASSHTHNYVPLSNNSNTIIKADADASSAEEYAQLQAGHNYLRVTSSAGGSTTTQGADKLTFNGNVVYHAGKKPTPAEIGAAAASHGTHVTWSTTTPKANGTAAVGTETKVARGDHVHPLQTTVSGNAGTATKLATARGLKIGNTSKNFDGSANVEWSLSEIGAAASNHGHSYLPLSGGTMTGNITFGEVTSTSYPANSSKIVWSGSTDGGEIYYRVTASDKGQMVINLKDDVDATLGIAYNGTVKTTFDTNGYYSGKANQANTLATARTINGTSFNGSANITTANWGTARTLTIGNSGKSVNGSGNVSWSLSEIGAAPIANASQMWNASVKCATWSRLFYFSGNGTTGGSFMFNIQGTRGNVVHNVTLLVNFSHSNQCNIVQIHNTSYSNMQVRCVTKDHQGYVEVYDNANNATNSTTQALNITFTPLSNVSITKYTAFTNGSTVPSGYATKALTTVSGSHYSGNAATATKLQTTRSINGTNFDGSGNITTANWGTARNIRIGNTTKSVNGSGNVSWSLSEIGAAASNHSHNNMPIFKSNHSGDWTSATSMSGKVNMGGWHGTITDESKTKGFISFGLATSAKSLDLMIDGDFYANENNLVLNAGNYNNYAPTKTGGGASGTWGINVSGNSNTTNYLNSNTRMDYGWNGVNYFNIDGKAGNAAKTNDTPTSAWWHVMRFNHANSTGFYTDLAVPFNATSLYYKRITSGAVQNGGWVKVLDSLNYNEYAPSKTGSGASGTWGISVSGNANTATKLKTARSIGITGAVSGSANFDGSGNISIITTYCYPTPGNFWNDGAMVVNANTGIAEAGIAIDFHLTSNTNDDYHTRLLCAGNNKNIVNLPTGNGTLALTSDNVASATKLQTARNIKIGNTSRSFNGTGDVTWTLSDIGAAASSHTHNYAASNHTHDSAYLKLSGGTLSGSLTVNNNVYSQGFCVSKNSKEVWLDIGDNDTYIWASGANKSLQITHSGDLNFDGKPVLYGGRGNNYDTATNTIYFNNAGASHKGRISCYKDGSNKDYVQTALRTANDTTNYVNIYEDSVKVGSNNICLNGKKLTIATSAPSGPATGDVWINIG